MSSILINIMLVLVYAVLLPVKLVRALLGRDTLQLRRPRDNGSYWLVRDASPTVQSYFSEQSVAEGRRARREGTNLWTDVGVAHWFTAPLVKLSKFFAPPKLAEIKAASSPSQRDPGIPDEVYTLW